LTGSRDGNRELKNRRNDPNALRYKYLNRQTIGEAAPERNQNRVLFATTVDESNVWEREVGFHGEHRQVARHSVADGA